MLNSIKVLAIGDVIGKKGRYALLKLIPTLKEKYNFDLLIVNVENTSHGSGLIYKHYMEYKNAGVNCMTMGNHTLGKIEINDYIKDVDSLIVPCNLNGLNENFDNHKVFTYNFNGKTIKVLNILGDYDIKMDKSFYMDAFDKYYNEDSDSIYIVDFHADITAEKNAFGYYLDGKASLMFGTHTHVQTADERILPEGMAYISDAGMCGSLDSVIGYDYKSYIERIKTGSRSFVAENKPYMVNGVLATIDLNTKKAIDIIRIKEVTE